MSPAKKATVLPGITGIIHTKNEALNVEHAIASLLPFVDEVLVADMASTDNTIELATKLGARVMTVPDFGYVEPARALAVAEAKHEWILILDADEVIPPTLADALTGIVAADDSDLVRMSRRTFMMGAPLVGSGWSLGRDRHIRFYRRGSITHQDNIHSAGAIAEGARLTELPATIDLSIIHFNYLGWDHFVQKLNIYTTIEARQIFAASQHISRSEMFRSATREFRQRYFGDKGYKDGYRGLVLSVLMAVYRILVFAKVRQYHEKGNEAAIRKIYAGIAKDALKKKKQP